MDRFPDAWRRARLVRRHHLERTAASVLDAVRSVAAFHSSDPATPHLGLWARVAGFVTGDLEEGLTGARTLCRVHAMRRTLFVVPAEDLAVFEAAAGREVAARERARVEGWLADELGDAFVERRLPSIEDRVVAILSDRGEMSTRELGEAVPELATELTVGSGRWSARVPLSSRLLYVLAMEARIVRASTAGSWRSSRYRWRALEPWLGGPLQRIEPSEGRRLLVLRYLAGHGPATETDVRWWTGWTVRQARAAVEDAGAAPVTLDDGSIGFVLSGDLEEPPLDDGSVALLPSLDPTVMGWKDRDWYLGPHAERLFDRNGNAGPTVWVDGRAVGAWAVRPDGRVVTGLLEDVGAGPEARIRQEAAALTAWLDGAVVNPRFHTPMERELSA